jgi:prepilin-type N-terminal cleavage/methylation domain-containing protein
MRHTESGFTWIEVLAALLVIAIFARYYWISEIGQWERETFGGYQHFVTVPLVLFAAYAGYRDMPIRVKKRVLGILGVGALVVAFAMFGTIYLGSAR